MLGNFKSFLNKTVSFFKEPKESETRFQEEIKTCLQVPKEYIEQAVPKIKQVKHSIKK